MDQGTAEKSIWVAETMEDITQFISLLPRLTLDQLPSSECCPICLVPLTLLISDSLDGKPAGVTKLKCGHVFCLSDISEWINTSRGSCPTCRDMFLVIPEPSEEESSDGGEYIPGSDLTDDFMEEDYWTEEEEDWGAGTEGEFEDTTPANEPNSSWDSEQHIDEVSAPAHGQILSIREIPDASPPNLCGFTEGLMDELSQLKSNIASIQPCDFLNEKEHVQEILTLSSQKTKDVRRILTSQDIFPTSLPDFQSILNTLQDIEDSMQKLLTVATSNCD